VDESSYAATAEFYDLLQATAQQRRAGRLLDRWLDRPRVGVLDAGAGTGVVTELLAARCAVPVQAVEPSAAMRAVLLSRLAGRPRLLDRVTVHAAGMDRLRLPGVADFALCLNVLATLDRPTRQGVLAGLTHALVPGGRLVVQRPPDIVPPARSELPGCQLGRHRYTGWVDCEPAGGQRLCWRFSYQVSDGDAVVRTVTDQFDGYLQPPGEFAEDLRAAGLQPVDADEPQIVVAHRRR
jgi:SAM-dependent methyltransferase